MTYAPSLDHAEINHLASIRMKRGIALLDEGDPEALDEAVGCFDEAIELRRGLPLAGHPGFRYGLAAGWINRGDALARMAGPENLSEAVNSHTTAIELLREVPADDDEGLFVRRLSIAWLNRGIALEKQEREGASAEAARSYREAIRLLTGCAGKRAGRLDRVLASAWINLGNALLRAPGGALADEARDAAERALSLLGGSESSDEEAAEAGLKARHILCQAATILLGKTSPGESDPMDLIGKLTDAVESALDLAQSWERAGVTRFSPLAAQFFHFGALVYERHQPHFLADFLLDYLAPEVAGRSARVDATWFAIAGESLARARARLGQSEITLLTAPQCARKLEILCEVRAAEAICNAALSRSVPEQSARTSEVGLSIC